MGSRQGLGTYAGYQGKGDPVLVAFRVRKRDLEPDMDDWKAHVRAHGAEVRRRGIDIKAPTARDTFSEMNQVRAHHTRAEPVGYLDHYKDGRFYPAHEVRNKR